MPLVFMVKVSIYLCQKMSIQSYSLHPDPSDIVFYEVKLSREDAFLVTGNVRHYPDKPFVVTPRGIIDVVEGK